MSENKKNNFDDYIKSLSTKSQIIYNQAFEIYKTISECVSDNVGNFWIKDTDVNYLNRGYEFVEKYFLNEDTLPKYENAKYELTREFKEKAEDIKIDKNKIGHRKDEMLKAYLLGMSKAFDTMNIRSLYSFTKDDLEKCKIVFSKLANGEKINEFFEKEEAIELKLPNITNLETIVDLLTDSRSQGNNVYVEFNGVKLYSCDVTMDKALLEIVNSYASTIDDSTKKEYINLLKEKAIKIDSSNDLDECIEKLKEYREKELNVYTLYRDENKLYSCDVTIDNAYLEVTGQTKEDFDKYGLDISYSKKEIAKQKAEVIAKINSQIEQGKKFIYPEKIEDWTECVESNIKCNFVKEALELMGQLDKGESFEKIKETLKNQYHDESSYSAVTKIVFEFSKKGPEFYEKTTPNLTYKVNQAIKDKKKENAYLEYLENKTKLIDVNFKACEKGTEIVAGTHDEIHHHILENYEVYGKKDANGERPHYHIISFDSNLKLETKYEEENGLNVKLERNKYYYMETADSSKLGTYYKFTPVDFDKNPIEKHLKDEKNFIKKTLKEIILNIDESRIERKPSSDKEIEELIEEQTNKFKQKFINLIDNVFSKKDSEELINKIRSINNLRYLREINEKIHYNDSILNIKPNGIDEKMYDKKSFILEDIHRAYKYEELKNIKVEIEKYHEYKEEIIKEINFNKALYHISSIETPMAINYYKYEKEMKEKLVRSIECKKEQIEEYLEEESESLKEESKEDIKGKIKKLEDLIDDVNAIDIDNNENNFNDNSETE